ncbi:unnamed protein product, partial [Rotaria sordida]
MNVTQDEVLAWSSGIEMVDRYAAYLTTELVKRLIYCLPDEQQCIDGTDEDRCEELELNECEENEYRCQDGLCIGEQYWLDGEYDCLDQTDEQEGHIDFSATAWCPLVSSQFSCEEINRQIMFFCEYIQVSNDLSLWTLENGHCVSNECELLKTYIRLPSSVLALPENGNAFVFRQYCDTLWQLPVGFDELFCDQWVCSPDEYQCLSGHCITFNEFMNEDDVNWHCPDASDKIGLSRIKQLKQHNAMLLNHTKFLHIKYDRLYNIDLRESPLFTTFCKHPKEYGCILANMNESINFHVHRPCINVTQIGDGIIDCYGGLDE